MKLLRLLLLVFAAIGISCAGAQETPQPSGATATNKTPDPEATLAYIHGAWDTLTRSMTDCHSLVDIKVTANPVLYLPAEVPVPPEVAALEREVPCEGGGAAEADREARRCATGGAAGGGAAVSAQSLRGAGRTFQRDVRVGQLLHYAGTGSRSSRGVGQGDGG